MHFHCNEGEKMQAKFGSTVNVHYKGTLSDGTVFDNSRQRGEPLEFEVGSGYMISGFNNAVNGMTVGQVKSVKLGPEEAYGEYHPDALQTVPRTAFAPDFEFILGGTIQGNGPEGPFLAKIHQVENDNIVLDLNHPLAGKELSFEIELLSVAGDEPLEWKKSWRKAELFDVAVRSGLNVDTKATKAQIIEALQTL